MTKFLAYYNLCSIPEPKDFLGISPDKDEGNIITTLDKNIVIIIKISTQKQIKSWSMLEKLSSKVVYDKKSEKYVGVFANKSIRCWCENTADVNKCKKLKFHKSIAELVVDKKETFVLYSDGTCESLHDAFESRKTDKDCNNLQQFEMFSHLIFSKAEIQNLSNGDRILTYFERNTKSGDYHLLRVSLQAAERKTKRFNLKRGDLAINVAGAAVIEGDGLPVLLTIWSDKRIFLLSLADDVEPERSPGSFVSMLTQLKVDNNISILSISKHFIAIYGANHGQEGASLLLYNTQYKVIKTKQFFKVYFNFSQLWSIEEYILLAMGQNLSVVKYRVLKEVLSELVGTQIGHDYQTAFEDCHINEEYYLEECLQYNNDNNNNNDNSIRTAGINKIKQETAEEADGNFLAFLNTKDFDKELNAIKQNNLHVEVVHVDQLLDDSHISLMANYNDNGFVCPEVQILASQMENAGASEHEITEKLLTVLMKANLLQDIGTCLRRYNNVSEKILSKTLSFLLQHLESIGDRDKEVASPSNEIDDKIMEIDFNLDNVNVTKPFEDIDLLRENYTENSSPTDIKYILDILLSCSFDADAIVVHIRKDIEYRQILLILQHLYNALITPQLSLMGERPSLDHSSIDDELQLFRWFGVFLNSHYQKLGLSKDVHLMELLFKCHELFQSYKREMVELQSLAAILYNIVERKKTVKEKNSSKLYSIEEDYLF